MRKYSDSFRYALEGIVHGMKTEKHLRFHLFSAIIVIGLSMWTGLSQTEWFIVLLLIGGMFAFELMNAAIERVVDLVTTDYALLAKQAKDLAAGAVLVYAFVSACIGLIIFIPKWWR